jgi:beta-N-acetylglucosaminidase.
MKNSNQNNIFGYIEGYYGKLLDWKSRKKLIEKMYSNQMNHYLYAPKEDRFHRLDWREDYPNDWRKKF